MKTESDAAGHLTEGELFTIALPPAGEPEALPRHLLECPECSRAMSEWKVAVRDLAEQDTDALSRRRSQEWEGLEEKTIQAIRLSRVGQRRIRWSWIATVAAALLLVALVLPLRRGAVSQTGASHAATPASELSAQDQADDALLRDVAKLSRAEEETNSPWLSLAPNPDGSARESEGQL